MSKSAQQLVDALENIAPGRSNKAPKRFEDAVYEALRYVFDSQLGSWHPKHRSDDGLEMDLAAKIVIRDAHDFWASLVNDFESRYIVFGCKNYSTPISQGQIYTTEKYLFKHRSVAIIISPEGPDAGAERAIRGALREDKLILWLTVAEVCEMIELKERGSETLDTLIDRLDGMMLSLMR